MMRKDDHLIYEAFQDNLTKTKQALGQNIMRMVKHGVPSNEDLPKIKQELAGIFTLAKKAGNKFTPEQEQQAKGLIAQLRNAGMPENDLRDIYRNAPTEDNENYSAKDYADETERKGIGQKISGENAETAEQRQERIARKWRLNKQRWAKWKAENPEKAKLNAQRKAGIYGKKEENAEKKDDFDHNIERIKKTPTHKLVEELETLYHIIANEKNYGSFSYDSAQLDIDIIHDELEKRGLNYQKHLEPRWNKIDAQYNSEEAEHGVSPGFHYDPSHHLMQAANQIADILNKTHDDEATPEHIEQMALKILGPQSEYKDYNEFNLALKGVIALLNRYVVVSMNEYEEMPSSDFSKLKQHINKGPIKNKKPSKELPYTHNYIHHLAKQDPREDHKEENAEKYVYTDIEVAFNIGGNEYIAYGDVHFGEEGLHGKDEDTVENFTVIDAKTRQEVQDEGILKHGYNAVYNAGVNKSAEENQENDDEEGDLMTLMKQKGMIPQNADTSTGKYGHHREEEEGICIEDLAKKFGVKLSKMQDELEKGIEVEMEHTNDFAVAAKIALDHLSEDPEYYIKLSKMEKSEGEERRLDSSCWKGYHKSGTKLKNGVRVNNCVKNS